MDVYERKKMEIKIEQLEEEIREFRAKIVEQDMLKEQLYRAQKMEALASISSGAAHDINNILQMILSFTELALMGRGKDDFDNRIFAEIEKLVDKGCELNRLFIAFGTNVDLKIAPLDINKNIKDLQILIRRTLSR